MSVANLQTLNALVVRVRVAQAVYAGFSQEQVDAVFRGAALAAANARIPLARLAVEESGMGVLEDKVIKNHFASESIYHKYKDEKTCGVLSEDDTFGTLTLAEPVGLVCGLIPCTNPTSTTIFKALISLKTRNGIVFAPNPRAPRSTAAAARLIGEAAVAAGAPPDLIGWIDAPSVELTEQLMHHPAINLILATGGPGMVHAAYSSGKPAIGVGAGNTPVVIDETADIKRAVASILMSKTFDHGVVCSSEQSVIVVDAVYDAVRERFALHGGHVMKAEELVAVRGAMFDGTELRPEVVGQSACRIAQMAGITVPLNTQVLIGEVSEVSMAETFAHEKLSPTLALFRAADFDQACATAGALVALGGMGHTSVLYTDQDLQAERIRHFATLMKTARILVNTPASQGGIGDLYNFQLPPSMTLGCGSWGGNSISENVGPKHLMNHKIVAKRAENMLWHKLPKAIYFRRGCLAPALDDLIGRKRCLIVTDRYLLEHGQVDECMRLLKKRGLEVECFADVSADPTLAVVRQALAIANAFQPDVILAFGGGSPMDAAKMMWVLYEHPAVHFADLALRFMGIRKRIYRFPEMGRNALLVAVPTTSGTGSEVTPFAVVTDEVTGVKYPIADYQLTPSMAIIDANLVLHLPRTLTAFGGIDAVSHAIEAFGSVMASEYTDGQALQALLMLKDHLPAAYLQGSDAPEAREQVHNAATIAGIAFANAFLGVCHSLAHSLGAKFHLPHGLAIALVLTNVIRYNAADIPARQTAFSQYDRPQGVRRYARIARHLGLGAEHDHPCALNLIGWIEQLKTTLEIPPSIQAAGVKEADFLARIDHLAAAAFDDQCTGANPRAPLIAELRQLLLDSYYGRPFQEVYAG